MSAPVERTVQVGGRPCRVWEAGTGPPLGYLAGLGGLPAWPPVLEQLAAERRVIAPSLPGFPGSEGHDALDTHLDWVLAARDLLAEAGLEGAELVGVSVGGALAAEVAALWPAMVPRLVLLAPFGLFDEAEPVADVFALRPGTLAELACERPETLEGLWEVPEGADEAEWNITRVRADEAAARILWPLGDTGLGRRLGRIVQPTLLLWGSADRVIPPSYARRLAAGIGGAATVRTITGAGHLADLDAPDAVAGAVLEFLR